ncbi:autotransporter outer membrane beta-barrel domain-containing protein [Castellaniella hirudinis]|uniref:autotransporter outer membrane beta-barrel domain-containing protein n=1 Tax=Castellaniella hirudinis TaxID=1144617 RepID=UPI0039C040E4
MKHPALATLALSVALALPPAAQAYSNLYFFGDSLSDVGAFGGLGGLPSNARWTTNNDNNWTNILAGRFGFAASPNNPANPHIAANGNNYAQGGAQANPAGQAQQPTDPSGMPTGDAMAVTNLQGQLGTYLAQHARADANALYALWIGGNDVIAAAGQGAGATDYLMASAASTVGTVGALKNAGARTILLPNLPDVGAAPLAVFAAIQAAVPPAGIAAAWGAAWASLAAANGAYDPAAIATALAAADTAAGLPQGTLSGVYAQVRPGLQQASAGYNQLVDIGLNSAGQNHGIIRADINGLFREILADPAAYGLTNVVGAACPISALYCSDPTGATAGYVFSDQLHPTPGAHALIADYMTGLLQAPYFAAGLPDAGLGNALQLNASLNSRLAALRMQARPVGTASLFVQGAYGDAGTGLSGAQAHGQLYTLGIDFQTTRDFAIGLAVSRQLGKTDLDSRGASGSVKDRSTLLSAYASYAPGDLWLDGTIHAGSGTLQTRRQVALGPRTLTLEGSPHQRQYGLGLHGGYDATVGPLRTGPVIGLDYARVKVAHFTEDGDSSSRMFFADQRVESLVGRLGWQARLDIAGRYTPYAKVAYAHEFKRDARTITSGVAATTGDWTTRVEAPDNSWMEWTAGITASLSKSVALQGQIIATTGRSGGNQAAGNIGLAVSF